MTVIKYCGKSTGCVKLVLSLLLAFQKPLLVTPCPLQCICDEVNLVSACNKANLDLVPLTLNPMIQDLSIIKNKITQIRYSFSIYPRLTNIDMTYNSVANIPQNTFDKMHQLRYLNLSHNVIDQMDPFSFRGLSSLLILKLNGNRIAKVVSECFESLDQLEFLDVSDNQIRSLHVYAFKGLKSLRTLSLSNNHLQFVPSTSFAPLTNLWKLDFCCNPISKLKQESFKFLRELRFLYLDSCRISKIDQRAFDGLLLLTKLHLHDNPTPHLSSLAFSDQFNYLQELTLGHMNHVKVIGAYAFSKLPSLRHIRVVGAKSLQILDLDAFANNTELQSIAFVDNKKLSVIIPGESGKTFPNLQSVTLRGNRLKSLDQKSLPWNALKKLDLRDNSFVCNCSLRWMKNFLQNIKNKTVGFSSNPVVYPVRCSREKTRTISLLTSIPDSELECNKKPTEHIVMFASLTALMCLIIIIFVAILIRYRRFFTSKFATPEKDAYIEPRQPIIAENFSTVMYDTCQSSPRRAHHSSPAYV